MAVPTGPTAKPVPQGMPGHELEVLEKDTDTSWALFQALQQEHALGFQKTEPADLHGTPGRGAAAGHATLDEVLLEVRRHNRVCPIPAVWQRLYDYLPGKPAQLAPVPRTRAEWDQLPALQKRSRLREHIEWAGTQGVLQQVYEALKALPEERWHHMGE